MNKSLLIKSIVIGFMAGLALYAIAAPQTISADLNNSSNGLNKSTMVQDGHLTVCMLDESSPVVVKTVKMMVTAYSSTPDQTDDSPFITASGKHVADGIVAINGLKFGTKVRIPSLYGDKVFVVEDRMHERMGKQHADVWMASRAAAINFGAKIAVVEIIES